jgi:hypothetical protein
MKLHKHLSGFRASFLLLADSPDIFEKWLQLVQQHEVIGKQVYDARLVAATSVHNLANLLTFNTIDFKRFTTIIGVSTQSILNQ